MASVESSNMADDQANNNNAAVMVKQEIDSNINSTQLNANNSSSSINIKNENGDDNNGTSNDADNDVGKTNLIVNYLPQNMTDEDFEELFKKFGPMKSCKIVRNRSTGYSYGFGFVDFSTHEQALKAIEELNGHELSNKKIKVAFARPAGQDIKQANLYIKNVPNHWTQDDVRKVFEPYGNIIQVRVLGENRGIAFVLYDLRKQAEDALEALNGKTIDGCDAPFEIKFAADKKSSKEGGGKNSSSNSGNNNTSQNPERKRERGNRGGRNRGNRDTRNRQGQRSFFDNKQNDRQQNNRGSGGMGNGSNGGQSQYNSIPYGGGVQFQGNLNNMNGIGPVRQSPLNRGANRFSPFIPVQQPMIPAQAPTTAAPIVAQMATNPLYNFGTPQQMIPFAMMPTQQMAPAQPVNQPGQMIPNQMSMYGTAQMSMGYAPITQTALSNIYSVASNNMNNAANMQPQIGQPMAMRSNINSGTNEGQDDGTTLFVYNIGPDDDENELRTMFSPYGQVVKCNVVRKTPGGETKGFGFVTLRDRDQANAAISGLNGSMRNGRTLQVSLKK